MSYRTADDQRCDGNGRLLSYYDYPELKAPQSIEYLARIEYEAQMKCADVPAMPWAELSETHKEIAKAGIRAVLEALTKEVR